MSITNGPLPAEAHDAPETTVRSAAIRFNGRPYIIFLNGGSWDCEPVPNEDLRRFEALERKWLFQREKRVAKMFRLKKELGEIESP